MNWNQQIHSDRLISICALPLQTSKLVSASFWKRQKFNTWQRHSPELSISALTAYLLFRCDTLEFDLNKKIIGRSFILNKNPWNQFEISFISMEFRRDSWMGLICGRLRRGLKDKATLIRFVPVEHSIHFSYLLFDCTWWTVRGAVLLRCIFSGRTPVAHLALFCQNTRTLTLLTRIFRHNFNQVIQKLPRALRNSELPVTGSTQSYHFVFFYKFDSTSQMTIVRASSTGVALKSPGGVSSPFGCRPLVTWLRTSHRRSTGNRKKRTKV